MAWIFIDMMPTDNLESAAAAAKRIPDSRMTSFHDPEHWLGRAMARKLSWKNHVAWDTYFVYGPAESWTDTEILAPAVWFHQLKDREMWEQTAEAELGMAEWTKALSEKSEADPAQFRTGEDLRRSLEEAVRTASKAAAPA